jgi:hypothetical protein
VNPRLILFLLPYVMLVGGILAAAKLGAAPGGAGASVQALGIAALGLVWVALRARHRSR